MKRVLMVVVLMAEVAGCCSCGTGVRAVEKVANPVKVGVYVGPGAQSNGVCHWQMLTMLSPDVDATFLDAKTIAAGGLAGLDVIVMPGGLVTTDGLDVSFVNQKEEIGVGCLEHSDVVILPGGNKELYRKKFSKETKAFLEKFVANGGRVFALGEGRRRAPKGSVCCRDADDLMSRLAF